MPIEFIPFQSQAEHFQILRTSMSKNDWHWIVPDGAAKSKIQKLKWESNRNSLEHCVSTAGSFWLETVIRSHSRIEMVSPAVLKVLIRRWATRNQIHWIKSANSIRKLAKYLDLFSPIFATKSQALFWDWVKERPECIEEWGVWYGAALSLWTELEESGWFPPGTAEALNLLEPDVPFETRQTLVFDLGFSLDLSAATIIQQLAKETNVQVFVPEGLPTHFSVWKAAYERLGYKFSAVQEKTNSHQFLRYASTAASLKQTTWQLRSWVEAGIHPEKILVCGDLAESEKIVLNEHLKFEGFPSSKHLDKNVSKPLEMAWLLNQLSILNRRGKSADLEWSLYGTPTGHALPVSQFLNRWRNVYDPETLAGGLQNSRNVNVRVPQGEIAAEEWIDTVVQLIGTEHKDLLVDMLRSAALKVPESMFMEFSEWTEVFAAEAMSLRGTADSGEETFAWSEWASVLFSEFDRFIVPDCSLKSFKGEPEQLIAPKDVLALDRDLGIGLKLQDPEKNRQAATWLMGHTITVPGQFFYSQADIDGKLQEPDPIWLKNWMASKKSDDPEVRLPFVTRWDATALSRPAAAQMVLNLNPVAFQNTIMGLQADAGQFVPLNFNSNYKKAWSLSAGQMEKALNCPFVFLAGKGLKLSDQPDLDLDVSHIARGRWYHSVLQHLKAQNDLDLSDVQIDRLLEDLRHEVTDEIYDEFMWPSLKKKTAWIAKRFLAAERTHFESYPDLKFAAAELEWKADWSREQKDFVPVGQGDFTFSGRIDRVDEGPAGEKVVYDYKTSKSSNQRNHKKWLMNNELQLILYSYVIENGFVQNSGAVDGAFYYFLKEMKRDTGMALEGSVLSAVTSHNKISQEAKQATYLDLREKVDTFVGQVERGFFAARPVDEKDCNDCRWNNLCRAPHLN